MAAGDVGIAGRREDKAGSDAVGGVLHQGQPSIAVIAQPGEQGIDHGCVCVGSRREVDPVRLDIDLATGGDDVSDAAVGREDILKRGGRPPVVSAIVTVGRMAGKLISSVAAVGQRV